MKISNLTALICAGILCAGISVRADDNAAQAAARAALMQKMQDLNSQNQPSADQGTMPENQPAQSETPAVAAPETNVTPTPPSEPASPPATFSTPPPPSENPEAQAEERAVIAQEAERATNSAPAEKPAEKKPGFFGRWLHHSQSEPAVVKTEPVEAPPNSTTVVVETPPPAPTLSPREQERRTGFFGRFNPFHRRSSAVVEVNRPESEKSNLSKDFAPIQPPPPPVSSEKDAELHALLQRYEANQISPDQYQTDRAEILGSP